MTTVAGRRTTPPFRASAAPSGPTRFDSGVRLAAAAALWLGLLLVVYWWAADGGIQDLAGWETGLMSTGRLSGLAASVLLLAQVLMMARLPLLEHAFGQDRLARHHRIVGFTSFNLMLAHIVLITWGYASGEVGAVPATFWQLVTAYPGVLLALAGTACLVLTVVTSVRAARRRIRYESWHLLHLYAYLGVGLALPHQLWSGQEFIGSTAATVFWWTAWALTVGAALVWRVGTPLWRSMRHRLRVTSVRPEGDGVYSVYLTGRHLDRLPVRAGQFFLWRFLHRKGWTRANPYSLSAAPDGHNLRITVKELGDNSSQVAALPSGTPVVIEGPYGRLTDRARARRKVALIGAGVGITPLRALAEEFDHTPGEVGEVVVLQRYTHHPLFQREFQTLAQERALRMLWLPGRRRAADSWLGDGPGRADDLTALTYWVPDIAEREVYVCGPEPWTAMVCRCVEAAGVPADRLHIENFAW